MSRGPYPILLMLAMSLPGAVKALGLGDIRVDSALNEPLKAQIDIVGATRDELAALTASVANHDIFQRYGADRPAFLSTATFKVGMDAQGRPVLNVRSADAFTDPLVSFLVDIRWGKNEMVREYSLLLDPPNYSYASPAAEVALASASTTPVIAAPPEARARAAGTDQAGAAPHSAAGLRAAEPTRVESAPVRITVAAGDTLRGVARRAGARSEIQAQTLMIAVFRANPTAFEGNINRLHRGAVLTIPTSTEVAAISSADAKREIRAHMTAWRLDGRPAVPRAASAPSMPAATGPVAATAAALTPVPTAAAPMVAKQDDEPDASLRNRVQSLEQQLDDMHKQLANDNARIQSLKESAVPVQASAYAVAAPSVAGSHAASPVATSSAASSAGSRAAASTAVSSPAGALAAAASSAAASPAASQTVASQAAASPAAVSPKAARPAAHTAELVSAPIIAAAHPIKATPIVTSTSQTPARDAEIFGPVAVTLGLMVAGFAYIRRRLLRTLQPGGAAALVPMSLPMPAPESHADDIEVVASAEAMSPIEAFKPAVRAAAIESPQRAEPVLAAATEHSMPPTNYGTTSNLEVDIEALERSYLDSLPAEPAPSRVGGWNDLMAADPAPADTTTVETVTMESVAIDTRDLDAALSDADLNTVLMDAKGIEAAPKTAPVNEPALDFDLLDLDATAQHVHMPSALNDHPEPAERRTNIADVLKMAIERDPRRRDLRMKLLETYYGAASSNQRAFMDVVRKLSRERDLLTPDDWKKVTMMGREIAADDILFADLDPPKDGEDLAHCA